MSVLCLDPGHGMGNRRAGVFDPGAVSQWAREADIVLSWAILGRRVLAERGIRVFLTREDSTTPAPLSRRVARAREAGCTRILSLHMNSAVQSASGTETLYGGDWSLGWARAVQIRAVAAMGLPDRRLVMRSNLAILRSHPIPSALLEIGFINSLEDVSRARDERRIRRFFESLAEVAHDTR